MSRSDSFELDAYYYIFVQENNNEIVEKIIEVYIVIPNIFLARLYVNGYGPSHNIALTQGCGGRGYGARPHHICEPKIRAIQGSRRRECITVIGKMR